MKRHTQHPDTPHIHVCTKIFYLWQMDFSVGAHRYKFCIGFDDGDYLTDDEIIIGISVSAEHLVFVFASNCSRHQLTLNSYISHFELNRTSSLTKQIDQEASEKTSLIISYHYPVPAWGYPPIHCSFAAYFTGSDWHSRRYARGRARASR